MDTLRYAAAGTEPTGAVNAKGSAIVSKTKREFGLRPRGVVLSRLVGTAPDQFKKYSFLPVLLASEFGTGNFTEGSTITIDSVAWTVTSLVEEDSD